MKHGTEEEKSDNTSHKKNSEDQFLKIISELSEEVRKLKENRQPVSFPTTQGMTADDIAKLIEASAKGYKSGERDGNIDYAKGIREEDIPADDYDEKGVRFCAPNVGYVISSDRRKGHEVVLPYNKATIFFEYQATKRMQQGKYESVSPYCAYTSHSKKEIEWLRNHTHYNVMFYESATQALSQDVERMKKMTRIMTLLNHYTVPELLKRCTEYGVAKGENADVMRGHLALAMADKEVESERVKIQKRAEETFAEALMVGKSNQ